MSYLVTAPCVIAKDQEGKNHHRYEGDVIVWLSDEQAKHFLESDLVVSTGGSEPVDTDTEESGAAKPPATAKKEVLVAWVLDNVAKEDGTDYTADELNELTKPQLQEIIDGVED